ncbi:MAG: PBP1A family penicillin-binding protein [Oscillospiraceae bacterium]|nr:PBP1A family penicillin-binding protein [Oscillospiraceae bacterium]
MNYKAKRIAKKAAKTGAWAISDILLLCVKAIGTVLLTAVTTGVVFMCIFLIYVKTNLYTELDINPADFSLNQSSDIYYIDPETGRQRWLVTLQSTEFREIVDYSDIPKHTINALVAIEDHRFHKHSGVDWYRTAGAFLNMFLSMKDTFGGSTITQQLIKNLTHEDETTVQRKLLEIFRALEYEKKYDKEEILELYLNLVYFGHGRYGIAAAADYYFGKDVSELTLAESASIIGITNNPSRYSPYANRTANKERQELILGRMRDLGYISDEEFRRARNERLNFKRGEHSEYEEVIYTWFEETVIRDVTADLVRERGISEAAARRILFTNGLKIISTLDPSIQAAVDDIYMNPDSLPRVTGSNAQLQSGIVIADPYTGDIKALSGGVGDKKKNMLLNRATMTRRPPGSAIKPLSVYAPAMEYGYITPDTLFDDSENAMLKGTTWMPKNADRAYHGIVDVRTAVRLSYNTISAQVLDLVHPSVSYRFMRDTLGFGLDPQDENYAPLSLGQLTYGATVREMTSGFTMFPNSGDRVELRSYTMIYDSKNAVFLDNSTKNVRAISDIASYWMTTLLTDVVTNGTGGSANLGAMPTAGKTGTTTDMKDRWFVGFTPYYIAAVWTGYDIPAVMSSSGNPAAQIWKMVMSKVHEDLPPIPFHRPENVYLPPVAGVSMTDYEVRCFDIDGVELQRTTAKALKDKAIIIQAPEIEGYVVFGVTEKTITLTGDSFLDYVEFIYEVDEPEDEEDADADEDDADADDDGDGSGDGEDETGFTPSPDHSSDTPPPQLIDPTPDSTDQGSATDPAATESPPEESPPQESPHQLPPVE